MGGQIEQNSYYRAVRLYSVDCLTADYLPSRSRGRYMSTTKNYHTQTETIKSMERLDLTASMSGYEGLVGRLNSSISSNVRSYHEG
jgi:hypothetical protein